MAILGNLLQDCEDVRWHGKIAAHLAVDSLVAGIPADSLVEDIPAAAGSPAEDTLEEDNLVDHILADHSLAVRSLAVVRTEASEPASRSNLPLVPSLKTSGHKIKADRGLVRVAGAAFSSDQPNTVVCNVKLRQLRCSMLQVCLARRRHGPPTPSKLKSARIWQLARASYRILLLSPFELTVRVWCTKMDNPCLDYAAVPIIAV